MGSSAVGSLRLPVSVLLASLCLTAFATAWVARGTQAAVEARFENAVTATEALISKRMETYVAVLHGVSGLFAAEPRVTRGEFAAYVERLDVERRYPGIFGIGFSQRLSQDEVALVEEQARADGIEGFRVWPRDGRPSLHSIVYLEPMNARNRAALGYDMSSEPTRRAAMERARDTGLPALSGKVTLVQEIDEDKQAGFLLYVPVYTTGTVPRTLEERRRALSGFAYSVFRADDLFRHLYRGEPKPPVRFALYDAAEPTEGALLHDSAIFETAPVTSDGQELTSTATMDMFGRPWTLHVKSLPALEDPREEAVAPLVGLAGLLVSLLLFSLVRGQNLARQRAERLAGEMSALSEERSLLLAKEQEARGEAERANQLKDEFLATVSHELRTPLSAILGWTQILKSGPTTAERLARGFDVIHRNARAQAQLIEDLLDVSRIVAGKLRLEIAPTDLASVVNAALESSRPAAQAKGVRLERAIGSGITVMGDGARLQQVVWNLVSNAIKFTPEGGRVSVLVERRESAVDIVVTDTGKGISTEFLPHIFDRFRQAEGGTTRAHGGLGIGLAIVRHLVELHGGTVEARSEGQGRGSSFVVHLPPADGPHALAPTPTGEHDKDSGSLASFPELRGARVLVVDDEDDARDVVAEMLGACGMDVTRAGSASEGFSLLREHRPDLLVSDIGMPREDGFSLIRRVRDLPLADGGATRALALTAYARAEERARVLGAGFDAYLAKPVTADELLCVLATLRRQPEREGQGM